MNAHNTITRLATAISLVLACGGTYAANSFDIQGTTAADQTTLRNAVATDGADVSITQIGVDGTHGNSVDLDINGADAKVVNIQQGNTGLGTQGNTVDGTITSTSVTGISVIQNTNNNAVHFNSTGVSGAGTVTVTQGHHTTGGSPAADGGSGFTANIKQTGAGTLTINQGNDAADLSTGGTATVVQAGTGSITITQGNQHAAASAGTIKVNADTTGGSLNLTQTNNTTTYVNGDGTNNATVATISGSATLVNDKNGGSLQLKNAKGEVDANIGGTGAGTVTLNSNAGSSNKLYVNAAGTGANAAALDVTTGTLTVNQGGLGDNNILAVKGAVAITGTVDITQTGSSQTATFTSANATSGTYTLTGTGGTVNVTF